MTLRAPSGLKDLSPSCPERLLAGNPSCQLSSESLQIKCHVNHAATSSQRTYVQWLVYVEAQRSGPLAKLPSSLWGWPVSRLPHRPASPSAQSSSSFSLQSWWSQEYCLTNSCKLISISAGHSLWRSPLSTLDWSSSVWDMNTAFSLWLDQRMPRDNLSHFSWSHLDTTCYRKCDGQMPLQRRTCCPATDHTVNKTASVSFFRVCLSYREWPHQMSCPFLDSPYPVTGWDMGVKVQPLGPNALKVPAPNPPPNHHHTYIASSMNIYSIKSIHLSSIYGITIMC